uniref:Uncharacterized protein n=1 Tax=Anguilla anguilla TaxID=7936 RepID=A0A0E9PHM1_ANGAN
MESMMSTIYGWLENPVEVRAVARRQQHFGYGDSPRVRAQG